VSQETADDADTSTVSRPPRSPVPTGRSGRGIGFYVGIGLVLAGFALLGYVAWQFVGTNIVARQTQQRVVSQLEQEWSAAPATTIEGDQPRAVPLGDASALIRIPAFGDDYVVPVLEGIGEKELSSGYGHFPGTAGPGARGNYALAAHRVTHGEPLRDMPMLRPGDEVVVETRDAIYTYELDTDPNDLVVTFEDIWVIDPVPSNPDGGVEPPSQRQGQRLITLTTCSELFHTDNRMIAFGHLVDTERK
jgi:sortase A